MKPFGKRNRDYYEYDYDKDYVDDRMASLDDDVTVAEEKLNHSIKRRQTAREMAVQDRIRTETEGLRAENKRLKKIIKKVFKKAGRPGFCGTRLYYSLYMPKDFLEYLIFLISAAITLFAVPFFFIKIVEGTTTGKVFLYIGIVVFFAGMYYLVYRFTNPKEMEEAVGRGRPILNRIRKNKQEIKRITRAIKRDRDDSHYDLKEFDNEITRSRGLYDVALARKNDFVKKYEDSGRYGEYDEDAFEREYDEEPEVEFREFDEYEEDKNRERSSGRKK